MSSHRNIPIYRIVHDRIRICMGRMQIHSKLKKEILQRIESNKAPVIEHRLICR